MMLNASVNQNLQQSNNNAVRGREGISVEDVKEDVNFTGNGTFPKLHTDDI